MQRYLREHTNPPVFLVSGAVILLVVLFGVLFTSLTSTIASAVQSFITNYFAWLLILAGSIFLVFAIGLLFTRYGNIRLGPDDSRPEYGTLAWFAMLYTAGMGIGLVYFAVAEPITHFTNPPTGSAGTEMAATRAINYAFFHWGLHPWATYIVLGLSLAYFAFRKGLPLKPSAPFYPLIGDRIYGPIGHTIDVLAVFGTMFGLATSLGIGAQQVGSGLNLVFGMPNNIGMQILLVAIITAVASVSVMLGLAKGIRRLSLLALYLSIALAVFVLIAGPTLLLLMALPVNIGYYAQNLVRTSFETFYLNSSGRSWQSQWTLFYWGWWISWSPFVGMFLARVSYGRTIRQFVAGVLFAPAGASFVWFTIFGDTTLNLLLRGNGGGLASTSESRALFVFFQQLPVAPIVATLASVVGMVVIVLYFATSSDSGSLVIDIITNGGDPNPIWQQRLFWAVLEGVVAAVLLLIGGVTALQTASLAAGLPLVFVLLLMMVALLKGLHSERLPSSRPEPGHDTMSPDPSRVTNRQNGSTPEPAQVIPVRSGTDN